MTQEAGELDKQKLEEAIHDALRSVLGSAGPRVNPRTEFYNKFQREMEEHDRDFEKKYNGDLDTTLIFSGLFSAVTSAFIIDMQSELTPDYEQMNNTLLEMLLNATTGSLPAGSSASIPRWSGPDPVIVKVQCLLYAALSAALLASLLAMLGKQWINRYRRSETHGSATDRSRVREVKLDGIETWKFHLVMESLPLILQCALVLLGFALSQYLWEVSRSVSSVVIGFTSFGFLFYLSIVTVSIFSFNFPFQTPFSLLIRFVLGLAIPRWRGLRGTFGPKQQPSQPGTLGARRDLPLSLNTVGGGYGLEADITALACIAPAAIQFPWSVTPLFSQEMEAEGDRLDARCITRMFTMLTDPDAVTSIMDFIPEIIWHGEIKNVPLKRIHDILINCFDFSGPCPAVIPKLRDVAYLSARAFAHIALQRRCITQYEEQKQDGWKDLCASHPLLSPTDYNSDSDLGTVLFMVDMTLGHDNGFPWEQMRMTKRHHEWMSHVFLYHAWHEGQLSEVVVDFVESSMSLRPPSDIVITDCLFIIGLMIGVPFHVSDITVQDKSREKKSILGKVFRVLSAIFSSKSIQTPSALRALRLTTRLAVVDVSIASYELFKTIMASDNLTDQHWEAARLAVRGAFERNVELLSPRVGEPKGILKFIDYHLDLQRAGEDHRSSITFAFETIIGRYDHWTDPMTVKYIKNFDCTSPSFVRGVRLIMDPDDPLGLLALRGKAACLISVASDQWFNSSIPVMEPEEMSEFCEHFAVFMIDGDDFRGLHARRSGVTILFGMLRSPEWREHIATRFWSMFDSCALVREEQEPFRWCLQSAIELLEFARGLPDGEGLKRWYRTLWFHYDKLDATVRDEVEKIARDTPSDDGLSDLEWFRSLIGGEDVLIEAGYGDWRGESDVESRNRYTAMRENYDRLAQVMGHGGG